MKVIFIKDLRGQGKLGEVKEVKDGYGKNFLIKNGYAKPLTDKTLSEHENRVKKEAKQNEVLREKALEEKEKLEKKAYIFKVKTGEGDKVFGSVSPKQIKEELAKYGFSIDKKQIELEHNLTCLGFHDVNIRLFKDVVAKIKVQLTK